MLGIQFARTTLYLFYEWNRITICLEKKHKIHMSVCGTKISCVEQVFIRNQRICKFSLFNVQEQENLFYEWNRKNISLKKHKRHLPCCGKKKNCVRVSLSKIRELINSLYVIFKNKTKLYLFYEWNRKVTC